MAIHRVRVPTHHHRKCKVMEANIASKIRTRVYFRNHHNLSDDKPTTKEETRKYGETSKKLLIYAACLNSAMIDLEYALRDAGIFRHGVKRNFNRASRLIEKISTALYKGVAERIGEDFCRTYKSCMESAVLRMNEKLFVPQPNKAYTIVLSLIRLTLNANNRIGRFKQQYITSLENVFPLLEYGLNDYGLDIVIDQVVNEIELS